MSNEIIVETGTILESLNNKVDLDGGNYIGSGLETCINKNSKSGFNLFDTKISDHILQGNEAKGWALQGTYVTKENYPDFYQRCLEEFKNENTTSYIPSKTWVQPVATSDATPISGGDMVFTASSVSGGWNAYLAFDGIGEVAAKGWASNGTNIAGWWQVKFPYKIRITGLKYYRRYSVGNDNAVVGRFYTSSEKSVAIGNEFSVPAKASEQYSLDIASIPSDGIVTDTIYLECQAVAGSYAGMDYLEITAVRDLLDTQIYKNPNGHQFYNIYDKTSVDTWYNTYGIADFYGIDEENERVFLPRNKYFQQLTDDPTKVNQMVEAGLPNITGDSGYLRGLSVSVTNSSGALKYEAESGTASPTHNGSSGNVAGNILLDASLSNSIYGNSDTVQPPSSLKLLYYCVGNTVVNDSEIDAGGLVAQMEQKANIFLDNVLPTQEFKTQSVSWGMPDYDSGVSVELNTDIVAPYPCFVTAESKANASGLAAIHLSVKVNNQYLPVGVSYSIVSGYSSSAAVGGFFAKGQTFRCVKGSGNTYSAVMYPLKGVN